MTTYALTRIRFKRWRPPSSWNAWWLALRVNLLGYVAGDVTQIAQGRWAYAIPVVYWAVIFVHWTNQSRRYRELEERIGPVLPPTRGYWALVGFMVALQPLSWLSWV